MKPTWTTLAAVDCDDIFDSGEGTSQYKVLGQVGKEGDEDIFTEVVRITPKRLNFDMPDIVPTPFLIPSKDVQVRWLKSEEEE